MEFARGVFLRKLMRVGEPIPFTPRPVSIAGMY